MVKLLPTFVACMATMSLSAEAITFSWNTFYQTSTTHSPSPSAPLPIPFVCLPSTGCQSFAENVSITQGGANINNFGSPRKSILINKNDRKCALRLCTGRDLSGDCIVFRRRDSTLGEGMCIGFSDGRSFSSFKANCR